ncbi:conserved hypothetical protein [Theileria equi strain WA]|uniref:Uncharacterized protein n=1 Tax=Theileria equi strain WA TaxID=1537102 RepID=L1LB37_THEEQ|nr:conserved hypothetical protein [Theileria equi strain WA]EKX72490.1 conserved hypothetical protein [Theileria equi strain WA]|eukprot:XP_004831942.1 conserved hypothetical protein [Theileria equi strain WA]
MYIKILVYLCGIASTLVLANLNIIPSQVLLPRTRIYGSTVTEELLNFNVQVKLKTEHSKCVIWSIQDDGVFEIYKGQLPVEVDAKREGACSSSVIVRPVSTIEKRQDADNETSRTFIYGYDLENKARTSAELSVSGLSFIAFETRNRRISIGQVVTLKVVGYDHDRNTFTSLEGIPFEVKVENGAVLTVLGLENDPQVSTATRAAILDMPAHFPVSSGYSVCTDVLVLKGSSVGKTKLSMRVLLPEYKHVSIDDVEFIVSEHIIVEPHRLLLMPASSYKFCVSYLESAFAESEKRVVDMTNYQWSTDTELDGVKVSKDGVLTISGDCPETFFRVITRDVRTDETFGSTVSVNSPKSAGVYYSTYTSARAFFDGKFGAIGDSEDGYLDSLVAKLDESCLQNLRTGKLVKGGPDTVPTIYLLKGKKYLFDLSLFDATNYQFTSMSASTFVWKMEGSGGAALLWKSKNEKMVLLKALDEGTVDVTVDNKGGPAFSCKLNVTSSVTLRGFSEYTIVSDDQSTQFSYSTRPLVLPLGESVRLFAEGGSGDYSFSVDESHSQDLAISLDNGVLHTDSYGTAILSVHDVNNKENIFKVQVIVTHLESVHFNSLGSPLERLYVEKGKQKSVPLLVKGEISGYKPVYTDFWSDSDSLYYKFDSLDVSPRIVYNKRYIELYGLHSDLFQSKALLKGISVGKTDLDIHVPTDPSASSLVVAKDAKFSETFHAKQRVEVYEPIMLHVDPLYQLPKSLSTSTFANVQVGGKVRVLIKGGHPKVSNRATLECESGNLHIEALDKAYDIYCLGETDGEVVKLTSSGSTREYKISCKIATNVKIYPARGSHDLKSVDNSLDVYVDAPDLANFHTNKEALHVFKAVAFDANAVALVPSHNFTFSWSSSSPSLDVPSGVTIDDSICTYKADVPHTLSAHLEWKEVYDTKNTSSKMQGLLKAKKITALISGVWKKDQTKRYTHYLADEVSIVPKLPHFIHALHSGHATKMSVFYNPNVLYRFMILGGSGDFTEVATFSEPIKFSHSPTFTIGVDDLHAPSDVYGKQVIDLFSSLDLKKITDENGTLVAKYVNFTCDYPATKEVDVSDKLLLWQKSQHISLQISHVSRMGIFIREDVEGMDTEADVDAENYTLFVGRKYIVTVRGFDASGLVVAGIAPKLTSNSASISIEPILEQSLVFSRYSIKVNAPGAYNIKAELGNYSGLSQEPNGPVATSSVTVQVYKEVLPLFNSITVLPYSEGLELPFTEHNESLKMTVVSRNTAIVSAKSHGSICKFSTFGPGSTFMDITVSIGDSGSSSKSTFSIPVHVKFPEAKAEITTRNKVLTLDSAIPLMLVLDNFTPFYLATDKKCVYEWNLEGPGHFVENGDKALQGPALSNVSIYGNKEGTIFVSAKVTCDVNDSKFETVTPKISQTCQKRTDPFTDRNVCPITMAENSLYSSKWDILDVISGTENVMEMLSGDIVKTGHPGDVLIKSVRGSHHIKVDEIAQVSLQDQDVTVKRGGKQDFRILLKDEYGCPMLAPLDLSCKAFSSNSDVLRVTVMGDSVTVVGVSEGHALFYLQIYANDRNVVEGFFRANVKNSIIPQEVSVVKGSNVHHISGNTSRFFLRLNFGLASKFGLDTHDVAYAKVSEELHKLLEKVGAHLESVGEPIVETIPTEEARGAKEVVLVFPLVCKYRGGIEEFLNATNEAFSFLCGTNSLFSALESGLLPISDDDWVSGSPSIYSAGSPGTAKSEGSSVIVLDSDVKGEGHVNVYAEVSKVEFAVLDVAHPDGLVNFGTLKHSELYSPYILVSRMQTSEGFVVETTNFVVPNVHMECRFLDDIHSRIFKFVPSQHMVGHCFYPSAHLSFDTSANWEGLKEFLKIADSKIGASLQLKVSLYTTKKRDNTRQLDIPLWSSIFDWKAPQIVKFVDSQGRDVSEVCQDTLGTSIYVYPFYGRYSLHSESKHYSLRILERSGLLCIFNIANNGFHEDTRLVVKNGKQSIGTLAIRQCSTSTEKPVREIIIERTKYKGDFFSFFTISLLTLFLYLLYSVTYRNERYYEPTVPIQVERKLPNVFEKIYKGDYDNIASGEVHRKLYA